MKKTAFTVCILAVILLVIASCDDNSRSAGNFHINIATIIPEGENTYSLLLDDGERLWPVATDMWYTPSYNQRVFLNYTILSGKQEDFDHYIKVNDIWNILTKEAIELNEINADSIGNDPVRANSVWVGGDYLNVSFMFNYGGVKPHAVNLVKNTLSADPSPEAIRLEFRHNSYQSAATRLYEGFVCFNLKPFRVNDADSVKLSVRFKEWSGETTYDVVYRYNQPATGTSASMPIPVISSNEYY